MSNRSAGYATHMGQPPNQPEIQIIKLHKSNNGMGLSIVAAKVRNISFASLRKYQKGCTNVLGLNNDCHDFFRELGRIDSVST